MSLSQTKKLTSALLYNLSLHHCMSVSLAEGGVGLGSCWGVELAQKMFVEAGWQDEEIRVINNDKTPFHVVFVLTKGNGLKVPH